MVPPEAPRLSYVYDRACNLLLSHNIHSLPVNPYDIIRANRWGVLSYSRLCSIVGTGFTLEEFIETCKSRDGFTIYNRKNYCIAYNDMIRIKSRILFTLMHEIGHIYCGHFKNFDTRTLSDSRYRVLEEEANFFASSVLAPAAVVTRCGFDTPQKLHRECGLSLGASKMRIKQLKGYRRREPDLLILKSFNQYIKLNARFSLNSDCININCDEPFYV